MNHVLARKCPKCGARLTAEQQDHQLSGQERLLSAALGRKSWHSEGDDGTRISRPAPRFGRVRIGAVRYSSLAAGRQRMDCRGEDDARGDYHENHIDIGGAGDCRHDVGRRWQRASRRCRKHRQGLRLLHRQGGVVKNASPITAQWRQPASTRRKQYFCEFELSRGRSEIGVLRSSQCIQKCRRLLRPHLTRSLQPCTGSPVSCYCSQIGGTDLFGGVNAAGGGWVLVGNANDVLDTCIFPDMSSIDSYGDCSITRRTSSAGRTSPRCCGTRYPY